MAKKKNTKKPVSKRTTRATLEERNKRLGKNDARKTRKPRAKKPASTITAEPAIQTVWGAHAVHDFLAENDPSVVSQVVSEEASEIVSKVVSWTPPAPELPKSGSAPVVPVEVEWTKITKNGWLDAAHEVYDDFISEVKKRDFISQIQEFSFAHPLIFGIGFCTAVLIVVAAFGIAARIFGW